MPGTSVSKSPQITALPLFSFLTPALATRKYGRWCWKAEGGTILHRAPAPKHARMDCQSRLLYSLWVLQNKIGKTPILHRDVEPLRVAFPLPLCRAQGWATGSCLGSQCMVQERTEDRFFAHAFPTTSLSGFAVCYPGPLLQGPVLMQLAQFLVPQLSLPFRHYGTLSWWLPAQSDFGVSPRITLPLSVCNLLIPDCPPGYTSSLVSSQLQAAHLDSIF